MGSYHWAKVWIEILYDYKMADLSDHLWRRTIELILLAKEVDPEAGYLPCLQEMAFKMRTNPEILEAELNDLAAVGIAERLKDGWFLPNFEKRQKAMTSAERVALHRERQKKQEYNESETFPKRSSNDAVTNRYIDKNKIKNRIDIEPAPNGAHPHETIHNMEAEQPPSSHNDAVQEMVSHIGGVVKDTYAIGVNSDKFEQVANALIDAGITTGQVDDFPAWWADNRHYEGRPALKSLLDNIKDAVVPVEAPSTFGTDFKVYNDPQT